MVLVKINDKIVAKVRNWDSALRVCANHYRKGADLADMSIISNTGESLPVIIRHLTA